MCKETLDAETTTKQRKATIGGRSLIYRFYDESRTFFTVSVRSVGPTVQNEYQTLSAWKDKGYAQGCRHYLVIEHRKISLLQQLLSQIRN